MKKWGSKILVCALCLVLALGMIGCQGVNDQDADIFSIEYDGVTVKLGAKAEGVIEKLGEPNKEKNAGDCGGLGATIIYEYSDIKLTVVDYKDGDAIIDKIELLTDSAETSKGIYIGADKDSVIKAYGEGESKNGALNYSDRDGEKNMAIGMKDGKVSYIIMYCE